MTLHEDSLPLRRLYIFATLLAVVTWAAIFYNIRGHACFADECGYVAGALDVASQGPFQVFHGAEVRTFGYPLFLAIAATFSRTDATMRFVAGATQLALYLLAAFFVGRSLRAVGMKRLAAWCYPAACLNVFIVIYAAHLLTETVSVALNLLALGCAIRLVLAPALRWRWAAWLGLAVGAALVVRPANLYLVAFAALCVLVRGWTLPHRRLWATAGLGLTLLAGIGLPATLQVRNNWVFFGKMTPLPAFDLGTSQVALGKQVVKYATLVAGDAARPGHYPNPFYRVEADPQPDDVWLWYRSHPQQALATITLKIFNVLDHDFAMPYNAERHPWYRWPLSVLNHILVVVSAVGLWAMARCGDARQRRLVVVFGAFALPLLGLITFTGVECRYGLPLLALGAIIAPEGVAFCQRRLQARAHKLAAFSLGSAAYIMVALVLSSWVNSLLQW